MSQIAISVTDLGKRYYIGGSQRQDRLTEKVSDLVMAPLRRVGRLLRGQPIGPKELNQVIWALRNVNLEIQQCEVVGLIGRNGSGKSTLLKILSRITPLTTGHAEIYGRVGSLLEVGTGFHPDLTGGENIHLNGAILGMRKSEIDRHFDEIVAFSEVGEFIDTPVKHYSSGMYMRLAFAVAAHLDTEILLVDEVLAVGDAEFQKKCLGKMQSLSESEGRTVLFVSHNMDAIQRLCSRCLMLEQGRLVADGNTSTVVSRYLASREGQVAPHTWMDLTHIPRTGTGEVRFTGVQYSGPDPATNGRPYPGGPLEISVIVQSDAPRSVGSIAVTIYTLSGLKLVNADAISIGQSVELREGRNVLQFGIEQAHLNPGVYRVGLWVADPIRFHSVGKEFDHVESAFEMEVVPSAEPDAGLGSKPEHDGIVPCKFRLVELDGLLDPGMGS